MTETETETETATGLSCRHTLGSGGDDHNNRNIEQQTGGSCP